MDRAKKLQDLGLQQVDLAPGHMAASILALAYLNFMLVTGLAHQRCPEDKMGCSGGFKEELMALS